MSLSFNSILSFFFFLRIYLFVKEKEKQWQYQRIRGLVTAPDLLQRGAYLSHRAARSRRMHTELEQVRHLPAAAPRRLITVFSGVTGSDADTHGTGGAP